MQIKKFLFFLNIINLVTKSNHKLYTHPWPLPKMTDSLLSNWQSNYPWIRSQYAPSPYNRKSLVILHNRLILYLNQWYDSTDVLERKHTPPLH